MSFEIIGGMEIPEPIRQAIDRHQMAQTASYHDVFTFFDELSKDQMRTLGMVLNQLARENSGLASYLEGIAATYMRLKHDTCMGCGTSHTPDFDAEAPKKEDAPRETEDEWTVESYDHRLKEYNLEIDDTQRLRCKGCGIQYPSIEDRMMKKPDDCDGCHQKAKWG